MKFNKKQKSKLLNEVDEFLKHGQFLDLTKEKNFKAFFEKDGKKKERYDIKANS